VFALTSPRTVDLTSLSVRDKAPKLNQVDAVLNVDNPGLGVDVEPLGVTSADGEDGECRPLFSGGGYVVFGGGASYAGGSSSKVVSRVPLLEEVGSGFSGFRIMSASRCTKQQRK
jgi:hypothetical protein